MPVTPGLVGSNFAKRFIPHKIEADGFTDVKKMILVK
jgi:hypothetical protein